MIEWVVKGKRKEKKRKEKKGCGVLRTKVKPRKDTIASKSVLNAVWLWTAFCPFVCQIDFFPQHYTSRRVKAKSIEGRVSLYRTYR